ncbi:MAG: DUF2383 domain-containing protein [Bacillota bacterium]|nr:DUF2383 domain-containing protein [Bacillota bacterium]
MDEKAIKKLQQLLRSVELGVENYDRFVKDTSKPELKEKFEQFKKDYTNSSDQIAQKIKDLGGQPLKGSGMAGIMQDISYTARKMAGHTPIGILKSAHLGETINIESAQKVLYDGIEKDSYNLVENHMSQSRNHMHELQSLIRKYEIDPKD